MLAGPDTSLFSPCPEKLPLTSTGKDRVVCPAP
jgi:hypothetical protein